MPTESIHALSVMPSPESAPARDAAVLTTQGVMAGIPVRELVALLQNGRGATWSRGQWLGPNLTWGDLLLIVAGTPELVEYSETGQRLLHRRLVPGELADPDGEGWSQHGLLLECHGLCNVYLICRVVALAFIETHPPTAGKLLRALGDAHVLHQHRLREAYFFGVEARVGHEIARLALSSEGRDLSVTEEDLAANVGVERTQVARSLGCLRRRGLIVRGRNGQLTPRDVVTLAHLSSTRRRIGIPESDTGDK